MTIRKKFLAILFGCTLLISIFGVDLPNTIGATPNDGAISLNFSYSDSETTTSRVLETKLDPATNSYQITGITGTRNGVAIDSLLPPDSQTNINGIEVTTGEGNDNLFQPSSPFLDESGFSYSVAGQTYNVYYSKLAKTGLTWSFDIFDNTQTFFAETAESFQDLVAEAKADLLPRLKLKTDQNQQLTIE